MMQAQLFDSHKGPQSLKGDLHFLAYDKLTPRLQHESRRVNQPTTSSRQTHARVNMINGPKSCRGLVVSFSHERKSYLVNRPLQ